MKLKKKDLLEAPRTALLELARRLAVPNRSRMTKEELAQALAGTEVAKKAAEEVLQPPPEKKRKTAPKAAAPGKKAVAKKAGASARTVAPRARRPARAAESAPVSDEPVLSAPEPLAASLPPSPSPTSASEAGAPPVTSSPKEAKDASAPTSAAAPSDAARKIEATELPESYGSDRLVLLVQSPQWAFAFWDISEKTRRELHHSGHPRLRLVHPGGGDDGEETIVELPVSLEARSWYIPLPKFTPKMRAEIGFIASRRAASGRGRGAKRRDSTEPRFQALLRSGPAAEIVAGVAPKGARGRARFEEIFRLSGGKVLFGPSGSARPTRPPRRGKEGEEEFEFPLGPGGSGFSFLPTSRGR